MFFAAFPLLASTGWYRRHHADHHRHLNTERDPDWARKVRRKDWRFPQPASEMAGTFLKQIGTGGFEWISLMPVMSVKSRESRSAKALKVAYFAAVLLAIHGLNLWMEVMIFWMIPLFFIFPSLQLFRSMTEHFGLERSHELKDARNTEAGPLECFFLSPHGTNYHLVHHLFPGLPHYRLRTVHEELKAFRLYEEKAHRNDSYLFSAKSVLNDLLGATSEKKS
ncbi:MAG TPA: fatty acid desaturase [Pseudobdellovibrionaceae bacterium]|nr:fatty acid desaturase [Pseudobdellovibrionaceae bacterium]